MGNTINVLDKGFVRLIDKMGDDYRVIQAARVSTGGEVSKGEKRDRGLINYLMKNEHWTPFEKIVFEFHIKCPIFVARQWMRHRICSYNEASGRYKIFEWECFVPESWRKQDEKNKQGSIEEDDFKYANTYLKSDLDDTYNEAFNFYELALQSDVAREQARIVMPLGQYTEFYWTVNFRSLTNFIILRSDEHAQKEIQDYANAILQILEFLEDIVWTVDIFKKMMTIKHLITKSLGDKRGVDAFIQYLQGF